LPSDPENGLNEVTRVFFFFFFFFYKNGMRIHMESKCSCPCHIVNVGGETDICGFCGCAPNMKPIPRNYRELQRPIGEEDRPSW